VDAYDPSGWVDTDIYHGVDFRIYANAVYLRGARFLQALRERMGEAAFLAFLKDYAEQMQGKISTSADLFRIVREHTSVDLSDIIAEYFSHPQQ
jgi:aminopeptidase N